MGFIDSVFSAVNNHRFIICALTIADDASYIAITEDITLPVSIFSSGTIADDPSFIPADNPSDTTSFQAIYFFILVDFQKLL